MDKELGDFVLAVVASAEATLYMFRVLIVYM